MTDTATPLAGGEAQPVADVNPIDAIIDNAETNSPKEPSKVEPAETVEPAEETEEAWPKKAENALAKAKGKAAQLKAERDHERQVRQRLEQQLAQFSQPQKKAENTGEPKEADFKNYADFMRAVQKYDLHQEIAKLTNTQQETQRNTQEQTWVAERNQAVITAAQAFIKETPDAQAVIDEYADVADEFSPQIQRLFLEADNAPLAFYNLAKEGKLEALNQMSLAKAAMEIGRAQTQAPIKPQTKAPIPLPASRGSVPSGKSLDSMDGHELLKWVNTKG